VEVKADGRVALKRSDGGLVTALESFHGQNSDSLWLGSLNVTAASNQRVEAQLRADRLVAVGIPAELYGPYYEGFCNEGLWPLLHDEISRARFSNETHSAYWAVNRLFADAILHIAREGDTVWIHDYHLLLLGGFLRRERLDLKIGFFLHIPFPFTEIFRAIPWHGELLEGLMGADLIGFHTWEYANNFSTTIRRLLGVEGGDSLLYEDRNVGVGAFPIGIDVGEFIRKAHSNECQECLEELREQYNGLTVFFGVDRLDYTKGIPQRLRAFKMLLEHHEEHRGKVVFVQLAVPTRENIPDYQSIKREVESLIAHINDQFGTEGYVPVRYIASSITQERLCAYYRLADVLVVSSLRDGWNLVATEYPVAKDEEEPGVLILSQFAGVVNELGGDALCINPFNEEEIVQAMLTALEMEQGQKIAMMKALREKVTANDNRTWSTRFFEVLEEAHVRNQRATLPKRGRH